MKPRIKRFLFWTGIAVAAYFMLYFFAAQASQTNVNEIWRIRAIGLLWLKRYLSGSTTHIQEAVCRALVSRTRKSVHEVINRDPPKETFLLSCYYAYTRSTRSSRRTLVHTKVGMKFEKFARLREDISLLYRR